MNIKSLIAGVALVALASPAFAVTVVKTANLGTVDASNTSTGGSVNNAKNTTFNDFFTIQTGTGGTLLIGSLTLSVTQRSPNQYLPGVFELFSGTPTGSHSLIDTATPVFTSSSIPNDGGVWTAQVSVAGTTSSPVPVGSYYFELTGKNNTGYGQFSPSVSVNFTPVGGGVPELSTWGMMLAGFGALGFAGYRRRTVAA